MFILFLGVLFAWPKFSGPNKEVVSKWSILGVECLDNGHANLAQHIHPNLKISIDGIPKEIPANIGILANCMAEIHTHDTTGKIHIETREAGKQFTLKTFFSVWGESIEKDGYGIEMSVDGLKSGELDNLILRDDQQIILEYTKK